MYGIGKTEQLKMSFRTVSRGQCEMDFVKSSKPM